MQGANQLFRSDPRAFLEKNSIACFMGEGAQKSDLNRINGNTLPVAQTFAPDVDFDLQLDPRGYYNLVMVGGQGSFATSSVTRRMGYGAPIVGNYIPYLGQKDKKANKQYFGKINLNQVRTNYVFTFTFTGCNFVVTKKDGNIYVYHEPTSQAWGNISIADRYPGEEVIGTIGPRYDDSHISGFGCLVRNLAQDNQWIAYVQTAPLGVIRVDYLDSLVINI